MKTKIDLDIIDKLCRIERQKTHKSIIHIDDYPISPKESMLPKQPWSEGTLDAYLTVTKSAINLIDSTLQLTYTNKTDIKNILDFPCGHGRVLRGLRSYFKESNIYACDLDREGVDFCASNLGAIGVYSNLDPEKVVFDTKFDLIWCGSLFTHLNSDKWPSFFRFFDSVLRDQGILIFTYAGTYVKDLIEAGKHSINNQITSKDESILTDFYKDGFGYKSYKNNPDYGQTICSPEWMRKFLENLPNYRSVLHFERGWNGRQDVIAIVKEG